MKKIEIYNYDTNETFAIIETRKKDLQKEAINYLKNHNFKLFLQGKVTHEIADVYWLSYNAETKEQLKLWYREYEKQKETKDFELDITD